MAEQTTTPQEGQEAKKYPYSRAFLPVMLEFAVQPVEFFFREFSQMMANLEMSPCEQVYALDVILRRQFNQDVPDDYAGTPAIESEPALPGKVDLLRSAGFIGLAAIIEVEPALWNQMAMEGYVALHTQQSEIEVLDFTFDKCVEVFRPCIRNYSVVITETEVGG